MSADATGSTDIRRLGEHGNAFGFLRLLFASLVIVAHVPELADGDRHRELLTRVFGTVSFGELAVDGFFLISGYLITGSFLKDPRARPFLRKRVARIYPAFVVAWLVGWLVIAPLATVPREWPGVRQGSFLSAVKQMAELLPLQGRDVFPGTPYPVINGAMWTIACEFRCYLLVLLLGLSGALRRRWIAPLLGVIALAGFELLPATTLQHWTDRLPHRDLWLGMPDQALRLTGVYLAGVTVFLFRDAIAWTRVGMGVASVCLGIGLCLPLLAQPAIATAGAYLVFAVAFRSRTGLLAQINNRDDISYGIYLYAWPTTKLLLWFAPAMPLLLVGVLTWAAACGCGWLSWHALEKPIMRRLR